MWLIVGVLEYRVCNPSGDDLTLRCAKCGKDKVIGEVSMQRARTHIKLYFCSNECASALTKALPAKKK